VSGRSRKTQIHPLSGVPSLWRIPVASRLRMAGGMETKQGAGPLRREDLPEVLLTRAEAAAYLGLSVKRLANLCAFGGGPRCVRFPSGSVRYEWDALREWAHSR
jgi:hypothetical protein